MKYINVRILEANNYNESIDALLKEVFDENHALNDVIMPLSDGLSAALQINAQFPNGFESWKESHSEIAGRVTLEMAKKEPCQVIAEINDNHGWRGLYQQIDQWTKEFEEQFVQNQDNDNFWDSMDQFMDAKLETTGQSIAKDVIITINGGIAQDVHHNIKNLNVHILDFDTQDCNQGEQLKQVAYPDKKADEAYVYLEKYQSAYNPELTNHLLKQI